MEPAEEDVVATVWLPILRRLHTEEAAALAQLEYVLEEFHAPLLENRGLRSILTFMQHWSLFSNLKTLHDSQAVLLKHIASVIELAESVGPRDAAPECRTSRDEGVPRRTISSSGGDAAAVNATSRYHAEREVVKAILELFCGGTMRHFTAEHMMYSMNYCRTIAPELLDLGRVLRLSQAKRCGLTLSSDSVSEFAVLAREAKDTLTIGLLSDNAGAQIAPRDKETLHRYTAFVRYLYSRLGDDAIPQDPRVVTITLPETENPLERREPDATSVGSGHVAKSSEAVRLSPLCPGGSPLGGSSTVGPSASITSLTLRASSSTATAPGRDGANDGNKPYLPQNWVYIPGLAAELREAFWGCIPIKDKSASAKPTVATAAVPPRSHGVESGAGGPAPASGAFNHSSHVNRVAGVARKNDGTPPSDALGFIPESAYRPSSLDAVDEVATVVLPCVNDIPPSWNGVYTLLVLLGTPLPSLRRHLHVARCLLETNSLLLPEERKDLQTGFVDVAAVRIAEEGTLILDQIAQQDVGKLLSLMEESGSGERRLIIKPCMDDSRKLIRYGRIVKRFRRGRHQRLMILFSDWLCYVEELSTGRLRLRGSIPLETVEVRDVENSPTLDVVNCFDVVSGDTRLTFFADTFEEKRQWMATIRHVAASARKKKAMADRAVGGTQKFQSGEIVNRIRTTAPPLSVRSRLHRQQRYDARLQRSAEVRGFRGNPLPCSVEVAIDRSLPLPPNDESRPRDSCGNGQLPPLAADPRDEGSDAPSGLGNGALPQGGESVPGSRLHVLDGSDDPPGSPLATPGLRRSASRAFAQNFDVSHWAQQSATTMHRRMRSNDVALQLFRSFQLGWEDGEELRENLALDHDPGAPLDSDNAGGGAVPPCSSPHERAEVPRAGRRQSAIDPFPHRRQGSDAGSARLPSPDPCAQSEATAVMGSRSPSPTVRPPPPSSQPRGGRSSSLPPLSPAPAPHPVAPWGCFYAEPVGEPSPHGSALEGPVGDDGEDSTDDTACNGHPDGEGSLVLGTGPEAEVGVPVSNPIAAGSTTQGFFRQQDTNCDPGGDQALKEGFLNPANPDIGEPQLRAPAPHVVPHSETADAADGGDYLGPLSDDTAAEGNRLPETGMEPPHSGVPLPAGCRSTVHTDPNESAT